MILAFLNFRLPLWLVLGPVAVFFIWTVADKHSAVRAAVNNYIAAEQIAVYEERIKMLDRISKDREQRVQQFQQENHILQTKLDMKSSTLEATINETLQNPLPDGCVVDNSFIERLHGGRP